jgi:hypothetical protein
MFKNLLQDFKAEVAVVVMVEEEAVVVMVEEEAVEVTVVVK